MATFCSRYRREKMARISLKYHLPWRCSQYFNTWNRQIVSVSTVDLSQSVFLKGEGKVFYLSPNGDSKQLQKIDFLSFCCR